MEPVVVEVKSLLKQGLSLFSRMMETIDQLQPGQSLIVKSTFNPRPLISQMRRRGYVVNQSKIGKLLVTTFTPGEGRHSEDEDAAAGTLASIANVSIEGPEEFLDNRGLVPPEPMQHTLAKMEELPIGTVLVIHNDRVPIFLLGQLDDEGYPYETIAQEDDSAIVRILKTH